MFAMVYWILCSDISQRYFSVPWWVNKFVSLLYHLLTKQGKDLESDSIMIESIFLKLGMINFSVVQLHLVHYSVQVPPWWCAESSCGLIVKEGIHIGFGGIVLPLEYSPVKYFLSVQQLGLPPVFPRNLCAGLSYDRTSELRITEYQHCNQLFLHWR